MFSLLATARISRGFREIRRELRYRCAALLPIGASRRADRARAHMNPEEAVKAFRELGAKTLVPMHYGTFRLGQSRLMTAPVRLLACAREHGIRRQSVGYDRRQTGRVMKNGKTFNAQPAFARDGLRCSGKRSTSNVQCRKLNVGRWTLDVERCWVAAWFGRDPRVLKYSARSPPELS